MEAIKAKKIGANISVIIEGKRHGKRVTKEQGQQIMDFVEKFNTALSKNQSERTLTKWKNKIMDILTSNTKVKEAEKESKKAAKKAVSRKIKKSTKKSKVTKETDSVLNEIQTLEAQENLSPDEVNRLEKLINKHKNIKPTSLEGKHIAYRTREH